MALARAIIGAIWAPPLQPLRRRSRGSEASPAAAAVYQSGNVERVRGLLSLGADPNQRVSWASVDWTPLGLAVGMRDPQVAEASRGVRSGCKTRVGVSRLTS